MANHLCNTCGETDPSKFYGVRKSTCKECLKKKSRARYHQLSEEDKQVYITNAKKNFNQWVKDNPIQYRFVSAKNRAKYKGLEFNITLEEIEKMWDAQDGKCFYTGEPMSTCGESSTTLSLDRVDSTLGYIEGNVVLCQWRVNKMKQNMSYKEFVELVHLIHDNVE